MDDQNQLDERIPLDIRMWLAPKEARRRLRQNGHVVENYRDYHIGPYTLYLLGVLVQHLGDQVPGSKLFQSRGLSGGVPVDEEYGRIYQGIRRLQDALEKYHLKHPDHPFYLKLYRQADADRGGEAAHGYKLVLVAKGASDVVYRPGGDTGKFRWGERAPKDIRVLWLAQNEQRGFAPEEVILKFEPRHSYKVPLMTDEQKEELVKKYKDDRTDASGQGPKMQDLPRYRMKAWEPVLDDGGDVVGIEVSGQRMTYFDKIATNESLGEKVPGTDKTVEQLLGGGDPGLARRMCANPLGVNVMCYTADGFVVVSKRGALSAVNPNQYCSTLSGTLPIRRDLFTQDGRRLSFGAAVREMIPKELGIGVDLVDLRCVAMAVGIRVGYPALLAVAQTSCTSGELAPKTHWTSRWETERIRLVPLEKASLLKFLDGEKEDGVRRVPYLEPCVAMVVYHVKGADVCEFALDLG